MQWLVNSQSGGWEFKHGRCVLVLLLLSGRALITLITSLFKLGIEAGVGNDRTLFFLLWCTCITAVMMGQLGIKSVEIGEGREEVGLGGGGIDRSLHPDRGVINNYCNNGTT